MKPSLPLRLASILLALLASTLAAEAWRPSRQRRCLHSAAGFKVQSVSESRQVMAYTSSIAVWLGRELITTTATGR